jgi:hypothetical protein
MNEDREDGLMKVREHVFRGYHDGEKKVASERIAQ